jgi:hypothetical protein
LRRLARNTVIFSIATGLSRIAGLAREIVASSYFGTSGPFSAFTLAFQIPNLLRALFADAALSAAFVPVFTELLELKQRKDAFKLASTLLFLIVAVLGVLTAAGDRADAGPPAAADRRRVHAGARRAGGRPDPGHVPDRRPARDQRAARRASSTPTTTSRSRAQPGRSGTS